MSDVDSRHVAPPRRTWTDALARWLRTSRPLRAIAWWISEELFPLLFVVFVVGGLTFLPSLALGPIADQLMMAAHQTF